jgi:FixJ family two-component response regulator
MTPEPLNDQTVFDSIVKLNEKRMVRLKSASDKRKEKQTREQEKILEYQIQEQQILRMIDLGFKNDIIAKHFRVPVTRVKSIKYEKERGREGNSKQKRGRPFKFYKCI